MNNIEFRQPTMAVKKLDAPPYTSTSYYRKNKLQVELSDPSADIPKCKFKIPVFEIDEEKE